MPHTSKVFLLLIIIFFGCNSEKGGSFFTPKRVDPPSREARESALNAENIGRSSWQKPELVVSKLGDIQGKTIADIGAGTGYFVYRLAYQGAKVIAVEIDEEMTEFIDAFKVNLPKSIQSNITTRLANANDPKLVKGEVDKVIIINTVTYIKPLVPYLKKLKSAIKTGGEIMILDFKSRKVNVPAPPLENRLSIGQIEIALEEAGFSNIIVDDKSLDYQYIVLASNEEQEK